MMLGWSTLDSWRSSTYTGRKCWYHLRRFKWKIRMIKGTSLIRLEIQISILLTLNASCSLSLWKILTATSWPLQKPRMTTPKEPLPRNCWIKKIDWYVKSYLLRSKILYFSLSYLTKWKCLPLFLLFPEKIFVLWILLEEVVFHNFLSFH